MSVILEYSSLYPFLLVAVRVLYLAANNPGHFSLDDLTLVMAVSLAGTGVIYWLAKVMLPRHAWGLPALVTLVVVAWVFGAPAIYQQLPEVLRASPTPVWIGGIILSVLAVRLLASRPRVLRVAATFLTNVYAVLAAWLVLDIGLDQRNGDRAVARSDLVRELEQPIQSRRRPEALRRDIYVLVLDEYANDAVLRTVLGFDNSAFQDSLRTLGFYVPRFVRSNYTQTSVSLASFLNAAHVNRLRAGVGDGNDASIVDHLVDRNRVGRYLQAQGYRFVFFPSSWWFATHESTIADSTVKVDRRFDLGRALSRTDFRRVIWHNTMLWWFYRTEWGDDAMVRDTFQAFSLLPSDPRPIFGFAHVISPHVPYAFDATCHPREHEYARNRERYLSQLQCVNKLVLETVTDLLRRSEVAPVIVLQGDHGTAFLDYSGVSDARRVNLRAAGERFGAFGAYFLPDGGASVFGDTVAVVDVLGKVLRVYAGADLTVAPDEQYVSIDRAPFDMYRVQPEWPSVGGAEGARH